MSDYELLRRDCGDCCFGLSSLPGALLNIGMITRWLIRQIESEVQTVSSSSLFFSQAVSQPAKSCFRLLSVLVIIIITTAITASPLP